MRKIHPVRRSACTLACAAMPFGAVSDKHAALAL